MGTLARVIRCKNNTNRPFVRKYVDILPVFIAIALAIAIAIANNRNGNA
jgi:hypothetical protein